MKRNIPPWKDEDAEPDRQTAVIFALIIAGIVITFCCLSAVVAIS